MQFAESGRVPTVRVRVESESACLESESGCPDVKDSSPSPARSGLESDSSPSPRTRVPISDKRCSGISGKLKSNADYHCRRCLEGENGLFQSVLLKEVVIEPNVKLECVPKFCYLSDKLEAGGGVEEAARARVRCAWAKFKELSPILTARGASYPIKGKRFKACVQSVLTYGTETWAIKVANLQSLERTERMMVRWMCGVSLKDRKRSVDLYSLSGVQSVDEVVKRGRLRWFGHVECKSGR